jgi:putative transposase
MAEYQHNGHAKYDIKYHIVWITKYRYKIITKEIGARLKELLIQGCQCRRITIEGGHIAVDHVHLLLSCPPDLSVSKIVQYLKGRSSRLLQEECPKLKKRYWGQHLWGRGYFCVTVGEMTKEMIKAYIEDHQEEEKPEITVHDEFQS